MRLILIISFCFSIFVTRAQGNSKPGKITKYIGKYEANGMVVQVTLLKRSLVLIVPGAPVQQMIPAGTNKFKTTTFGDEPFLFVEKNGKIEEMISQSPGQSLKLKKISDTPDDFNHNDSLLNLKKSTRHFSLLYSKIDSISVNHIADKLEADYKKIISDFKINTLPVTTVRIYPDPKSFHQGINFPNAPDEVLATAFGKDDFRMVSPNAAGVDSGMLMKGVTHEFTHCVHLNIDYSPNNPRWLWEGVAMYESGWFFNPLEIDIIKQKNFPPLAALNNGMEYMLGYVIIEAIKDIWGFDTVISLIKKRGNIQGVLKLTEDKFEEMIFEYIYKKYSKNDIPYPQPLPDSTALVFLPGLVSKDSFDFNAAFSPDGKSFYFSRSLNKQSSIYATRYDSGKWTEPILISLPGTNYSDADPAFGPDGKLYFISNRPANTSDTTADYDIWFSSPTANGAWSAAENMGTVNSDSNEFYISFSEKGNMYFASSRKGGFGEEDIYISRLINGQYTTPDNLGTAINSSKSEYDPGISAKEDLLIFTSSNRDDSFGGADLYYTKPGNNGKWQQAIHLGKNINTPSRDFCPSFSPDSKYFFFSSERDVKWISASYLYEQIEKSK